MALVFTPTQEMPPDLASSLNLSPGTMDELTQYIANVSTGAANDAYNAIAPDVNAGFTLASAYLVFFMHCGFAMISVGCVRAKYAKHIAILVLVDGCASALAFYLTGYAFAFGDNTTASGLSSGNGFIGTNFFALSNLPDTSWYLFVFQWSFAATACTIVSGAIAERARFESYILYSCFMGGWVYPLIVHSVWSSAGWANMLRDPNVGGLFLDSGVIDFAGSGVVHMVGGVTAGIGCWILGPRIGRFLSDGTIVEMNGHNTSLFVLGVMILWFGWYGFNPGSQLALVNGNSIAVANAAVTTTLAPGAAGMSALLTRAVVSYRSTGRVVYDLMAMGNGCLAGLAAITAPCSTVYPWAAIVIGGVAGVLYCVGSQVSLILHLDDPLDAIAVHAWNGIWGVWAAGLFAAPRPIFTTYGYRPGTTEYRYAGAFYGDSHLFGAQIIYSFWIFGWMLVNFVPFFTIIKMLGWFRVAAADETTGLDDSYHGGGAYGDMPIEKDPAAKAPARKADVEELRSELLALKNSIGKNGTAV